MEEVDVSYSSNGTTITSVDTGVPTGTYEADGSQINPETEMPYEPGTPLYNDENGQPQPATTNQDPNPVVYVNSTQTWAILEAPLRRESLIFDRPTKFGKFREAIDWVPVNTISSEWGKLQIIIGGVDVTYFRGHPTELGSWSSNEPNGDAATSITFPQISWWERPNHGEISWTQAGKDVTILLVRPDGSTKTLFEGLNVSHVYNGQGLGVGLDVLGVLYQADHTPYIQELYKNTSLWSIA